MVGALQVKPDDEIMLISSGGTLVRTPVGGNLDPGPQHAGRAPDPARRRRSPGRYGAYRRRTAEEVKEEGEVGEPAAESPSPLISIFFGSFRSAMRLAYTSLPSHMPGSIMPIMRVFNFSPGPAPLPSRCSRTSPRGAARLARHRHVGDGDEPSRQGVHRIAEQAEADLRELLAVPTNYKVLFLQGGATAQFAAFR